MKKRGAGKVQRLFIFRQELSGKGEANPSGVFLRNPQQDFLNSSFFLVG
ncbi:MAG: hypothetical protein R3209_10660 [Salinimicrobium sediminis]|nr:hypothetical protein [Salinimicrobium sediminis]